jgi:hypothetical protein
VLVGKGLVGSTHVEVNFVCSLALDGFGQHKFRCILCVLCHGLCLVNKC